MDDVIATPAAGGSAREARRRKILDRGTDRLAFITGLAKSVPPPQPSSDPSLIAAVPERRELQEDPIRGKGDLPLSSEAKSDLTNEATRKSVVTDIGFELLTRRESSNLVAAPKAHPAQERSIPSATAYPSSQVPNEGFRRPQIFTANRISECISSSENIRLFCAAAIALFVILYYQGIYIGGKMVANLINFRPVYLVIVTDITLVFALLLANRVPLEKEGDGKESNREEYDAAELLRLGLLVYKAAGALFGDCCLCVALMIIGIPFGEHFMQ